MIVMSSGSLWDVTYGQAIAAHEFYHAVQHASEAYTGAHANWYWESTASWIEKEVFPSDTTYAAFLFGYAFQPHHQLNDYTYPSQGIIEEYHQYGAFIFPRFITEHRADWTVIRDSWVDGGLDGDPVDVLADLLPEEDFEVLFGDFAAHNAAWDYIDGSLYASDLEYWSEQTQFGSQDDRFADFVGNQGTGDAWRHGQEATLPERFGYNVIRLSSPVDRDLVVRFQGEAEGSEGSAARYQVRLVQEFGSTITYTPVELEGTSGVLDAGRVGDEVALYLVVAAFSDAWNKGETFAYKFQLDMGEVIVAEDDDPMPEAGPTGIYADNDKACGCATAAPQRLYWGVWILGLFLGWSRRVQT